MAVSNWQLLHNLMGLLSGLLLHSMWEYFRSQSCPGHMQNNHSIVCDERKKERCLLEGVSSKGMRMMMKEIMKERRLPEGVSMMMQTQAEPEVSWSRFVRTAQISVFQTKISPSPRRAFALDLHRPPGTSFSMPDTTAALTFPITSTHDASSTTGMLACRLVSEPRLRDTYHQVAYQTSRVMANVLSRVCAYQTMSTVGGSRANSVIRAITLHAELAMSRSTISYVITLSPSALR